MRNSKYENKYQQSKYSQYYYKVTAPSTACIFFASTILTLSANANIFQTNLKNDNLTSLSHVDKIHDKTEQVKQQESINASTLPLKNPSLYKLLSAEFAYESGNIEQAIATYKTQASSKNATTVFERALSLSLQHEPVEESLSFALAWHKKNPNHVPAWFYVSHLALQAGDYRQAGESLARILTYDPKADLTEILNGIYPEDETNQRQLLQILQELDIEQNAALSVLEAGLLLKFNEPKIALIHINRAIKLEPDNEPYLILKADILKQLKRHDELLFFLDNTHKQLPEQKSLYLYQIRYLLSNVEKSTPPADLEDYKPISSVENQKMAWQLLLTTHKIFPDDPEITLLAALVSLDLAEHKVADELLISLLDRPAFIDQANYYLGVSAERKNDLATAIFYFKKVQQANLVLAASKKIVAFELVKGNTDAALKILETLRSDFGLSAQSSVNVKSDNTAISTTLNGNIITNLDPSVSINISIESYLLQANILQQIGRTSAAKELIAQAYLEHSNHSKIIYTYTKLLDQTSDYLLKKQLLKKLYTQIKTDTIDDSLNPLIHQKIREDYKKMF